MKKKSQCCCPHPSFSFPTMGQPTRIHQQLLTASNNIKSLLKQQMVHFKSYQPLLHTVITGVVKTSTPRELCHSVTRMSREEHGALSW